MGSNAAAVKMQAETAWENRKNFICQALELKDPILIVAGPTGRLWDWMRKGIADEKK